MKIKFEVDIDNSEKELFKTIMSCSTDNELKAKLNKIGRASFEEMRRMVIGQKVFTRGRDILEFRLFNLIAFYFDGKIPDEQKICDLFQITATESRALIRSIMSKYQYDLKETIQNSLKEEIASLTKEEDDEFYRISIQNLFIKDELNKILGSIDNSLPIIEKESKTISIYKIMPSAYKALCEKYEIELEE